MVCNRCGFASDIIYESVAFDEILDGYAFRCHQTFLFRQVLMRSHKHAIIPAIQKNRVGGTCTAANRNFTASGQQELRGICVHSPLYCRPKGTAFLCSQGNPYRRPSRCTRRLRAAGRHAFHPLPCGRDVRRQLST